MEMDLDKAVPAAAQAMVDMVRRDHGLQPMSLDKMPEDDPQTWRRRACAAIDAAVPFIG